MHLHTYRDQSRSGHLDLIGGRGHMGLMIEEMQQDISENLRLGIPEVVL